MDKFDAYIPSDDDDEEGEIEEGGEFEMDEDQLRRMREETEDYGSEFDDMEEGEYDDEEDEDDLSEEVAEMLHPKDSEDKGEKIKPEDFIGKRQREGAEDDEDEEELPWKKK